MSRRSLILLSVFFTYLILLPVSGRATKQNSFPFESGPFALEQDSAVVHELTIYVIPSYSELKWESPSSLYRSTALSYTKSLFKPFKYSIGHLFIEFSSPLLDSVILTSIRSSSESEKRRLVLKDKIGLGILGAVMHGRMESREELIKKMSYFSKKKQLAFIKYRISKESALRIIDFLKIFCTASIEEFNPGHYYSGAFWPRFEKEGAGCSSFGMSVMEVAGLCIDYPGWRLSLNIPMNLVGGEYNNNSKVKRLAILKTDKWHSGEGVENIDYIPLTMYDPSLIFKWIIERRKTGAAEVAEKDNIPGLYFDARNINVPSETSIFTQRSRPSLFIDVFRKNLK